MELAFSYVYKITILPPELDRIIIDYLVKDKFNRLSYKLQSFYDDRKYYKFLPLENKYEEISYYNLLNIKLYNMIWIYDKFTIRYRKYDYDSYFYAIIEQDDCLDNRRPEIYAKQMTRPSLSLHHILQKMSDLIDKNNKNPGYFIAFWDGFRNEYISKSELLKMEPKCPIIKKSD